MKPKNYGATIETSKNDIELSTTDGRILELLIMDESGSGRHLASRLTPGQVRGLIVELAIFQKLQQERFA